MIHNSVINCDLTIDSIITEVNVRLRQYNTVIITEVNVRLGQYNTVIITEVNVRPGQYNTVWKLKLT